MRNGLLRMVEPGSGGSERLLTLRLNSTTGPVTLISVYAPILSATSDTKDMFYENLASIIRNIPSKKQVVVLGDFNARVGADHDSWPFCHGQFGVGKMNENGLRLLEMCSFHELCITNSFRTKPQHRVSWRHSPSKHWHQLDLILVRRAAIKNVLHIRSYHNADCDTVHSLVCCKTRIQPKKFHHTKTKGIPLIDVSKMSQPDLTEQFAQTFEKEFGSLQPGDSAIEKWEVLRDTMYRTVLATFGKRSSESHDWFEAKSTVMTPIIEAKRAVLAVYKRTPRERNLQILRIARSKAQQTARHQESTRTYPEQDRSPQIFYRGSYHGQRTSAGEMGRTLLRHLL